MREWRKGREVEWEWRSGGKLECGETDGLTDGGRLGYAQHLFDCTDSGLRIIDIKMSNNKLQETIIGD